MTSCRQILIGIVRPRYHEFPSAISAAHVDSVTCLVFRAVPRLSFPVWKTLCLISKLLGIPLHFTVVFFPVLIKYLWPTVPKCISYQEKSFFSSIYPFTSYSLNKLHQIRLTHVFLTYIHLPLTLKKYYTKNRLKHSINQSLVSF